MSLTETERDQLTALNEDHHRRMREDYAKHEQSGALPGILHNDELSREHLVQAMLNCEARCHMRPERPDDTPRVLELGCGSGRDAGYLDYLAIDVVEVPQAGRLFLEPSRFRLCSVEDMPDYWEGRFRYIYSRHVMEHVLNADRALERLKKVLAPDGIIGAVTPHLFPDNEPAHVTKLDVKGWFDAYERNGLRVVYCPVLQYNCPEVVLVAIHKEWDWPPKD